MIPKSFRSHVINLAHERHLGIVKTKTRTREVVWWPEMNSQLEQAVSNVKHAPVPKTAAQGPSSIVNIARSSVGANRNGLVFN